MPNRTVLLTLGALAACGASDTAKRPAAPGRTTPAVTPLARPDTAGLARDIPRLLQVSGIPGLSIAVVQSGRVVWTGAFGTVNDRAQTPLDSTTIFEAASLSKPVFAYIVLRLADRGAFDLDRPLSEMLGYPRLARDARSNRITARMVLSHGTGLPNWGGETLTVAFEPGSAYGYSGEGFLYLQKVVERVTGRTLDELARREVFAPLGMTRSGYVWHDRFAGHAAYARDWLWNVASVNHYTDGEANAAASLLTTAPDYARFVAAVMTGHGLSPAMWRTFLTPVHATGPGISMALGVRVEDGAEGRIFYHSGNNGRRFTCYMTGDLGRRLGFVYFTGAPNGTSLVTPLASHVFGDEHPARHRSDFDRYDDPRRMALRSVERAAAERGPDAAQERLRAIEANPETRPSFDATLELGAFFAGRGLPALAIEVLRKAVTDAPDSAGAHVALGRALESAGDLTAAIAEYRRGRALEGDGEAGRQLRWAEERLALRARPVVPDQRALQRYVGRYQERAITLRAGRLYYSGGLKPESPLTPMAPDLFEVAAEPATRIRFVGGGTGPAVEMVAIYRDGTIDEWPRSR